MPKNGQFESIEGRLVVLDHGPTWRKNFQQAVCVGFLGTFHDYMLEQGSSGYSVTFNNPITRDGKTISSALLKPDTQCEVWPLAVGSPVRVDVEIVPLEGDQLSQTRCVVTRLACCQL